MRTVRVECLGNKTKCKHPHNKRRKREWNLSNLFRCDPCTRSYLFDKSIIHSTRQATRRFATPRVKCVYKSIKSTDDHKRTKVCQRRPSRARRRLNSTTDDAFLTTGAGWKHTRARIFTNLQQCARLRDRDIFARPYHIMVRKQASPVLAGAPAHQASSLNGRYFNFNSREITFKTRWPKTQRTSFSALSDFFVCTRVALARPLFLHLNWNLNFNIAI